MSREEDELNLLAYRSVAVEGLRGRSTKLGSEVLMIGGNIVDIQIEVQPY